MLRQWSSLTPLSGDLTDDECRRCGRKEEVPLGEICTTCRQEIDRKARRYARLAASITTLILAVYLYFRLPNIPNSRIVGVTAVIAWYIIVSRIVQRVLQEVFK